MGAGHELGTNSGLCTPRTIGAGRMTSVIGVIEDGCIVGVKFVLGTVWPPISLGAGVP
jgi:hypothetical protein